jgi:hypothetical protein
MGSNRIWAEMTAVFGLKWLLYLFYWLKCDGHFWWVEILGHNLAHF